MVISDKITALKCTGIVTAMTSALPAIAFLKVTVGCEMKEDCQTCAMLIHARKVYLTDTLQPKCRPNVFYIDF